MKADEFCSNAAELMADRASSRDTGEERSMARCVQAFNALYGHSLSETEGWQFMSLLKKARGSQGAYRQDDFEDDVAYCALAGESSSKDRDVNFDSTPAPLGNQRSKSEPTISEYTEIFGNRGRYTGTPLNAMELLNYWDFIDCESDSER